MATAAPSAAKRRAMAAPIPRLAPVTEARLPSSEGMVSSVFVLTDTKIRALCIPCQEDYMSISTEMRNAMAARGRPRSFDREQALARAMEIFWAKGFEGTSMTDLTEAMGIGSPSLYAAFGS